jgi:catechol 2,3-dioxygenase-like lactoylglutathione lyase family enzyme
MSVVHSHTFQHAGFPVNDLIRAKDFYVNILGLKVDGPEPTPQSRQVRMYCGGDPNAPGQQVVLFRRATPIERDSAENQLESLRRVEEGDTVAAAKLVQDGRTHQAFVITPEEFQVALVKFKELGIPFCKDVPRGNHNAMYFFDPDGNQLQLTDHL